jgi:hypothetical protein
MAKWKERRATTQSMRPTIFRSLRSYPADSIIQDDMPFNVQFFHNTRSCVAGKVQYKSTEAFAVVLPAGRFSEAMRLPRMSLLTTSFYTFFRYTVH